MLLGPVLSVICLVTVCTKAVISNNSSNINSVNGNWKVPNDGDWQGLTNETRSARTVDILSSVLSKITTLGSASKPPMMSPSMAMMPAAPPIQSGFMPSSYDSSGTSYYYTPPSSNTIDQRYAMAPSKPYSASGNDKTYGDALYGSNSDYANNNNNYDYGSNQYNSYPTYGPNYHKGYHYPMQYQPGYDVALPPKDDFDGIKDFLLKLLALIPVGLLLGAIIPSLVVIPSKRSAVLEGEGGVEDDDMSFLEKKVQESYPILDLIEWYGPQSITDPDCIKNLICYIAREGMKDGANFVQKAMWLLANRLDPKTAAKMKVTDLRYAILNDKCLEYKCDKSKTPEKP